jgi:hypothetical protein
VATRTLQEVQREEFLFQAIYDEACALADYKTDKEKILALRERLYALVPAGDWRRWALTRLKRDLLDAIKNVSNRHLVEYIPAEKKSIHKAEEEFKEQQARIAQQVVADEVFAYLFKHKDYYYTSDDEWNCFISLIEDGDISSIDQLRREYGDPEAS